MILSRKIRASSGVEKIYSADPENDQLGFQKNRGEWDWRITKIKDIYFENTTDKE